jgi:hypothetical protein
MALSEWPVRRKRGGFVPFLLATVRLSASSVLARDLTFEDRVKAQEAIERVYWSHRLWPGENRRQKPPLEAVLSDARERHQVHGFRANPGATARPGC